MIRIDAIAALCLCLILSIHVPAGAASPPEQRAYAFNIQENNIEYIEIYKSPRHMTTTIGIKPDEVKDYPNRHCIFINDTREFTTFLSEISRTRYQKKYMNNEFHWQMDFKDRNGNIIHRLYSGPFYDNAMFVNAIWNGNHIVIENRFLRWAEEYINAQSNFCEDKYR